MPNAGLAAQWQLADLVGVGRIESVQARIDRLYKGETASREIRFREYTDVDFAGVSYRDDTRSGGLQLGHSVMFFLKKREGDPAYRAVADYRGGYLMIQCAGPASPEEALLSPACQGDPSAADYLDRFDERATMLVMLQRLGPLYNFAATAYGTESKPLGWALAFWLSRLGVCRGAAREAASEIRRLWSVPGWSVQAFQHLDSPTGALDALGPAGAVLQAQGGAGLNHPGVQAFIRCHPDSRIRAWSGLVKPKEANQTKCVPCE